jgi:Tol biopolymer transport system component
VQGKTLDQLIRDRGFVLNQTLKRGVQIADAMTAAHAAGIIHRDIKPANIMVTDTELVKVLDFGLAKLTEPAEGAGVEASHIVSLQTGAGVILGTVAYMSPEQAKGEKVDPRSDIFSFGLVLYEMATGRPAFSGETKAATLTAIIRGEPKPVSQVAPDTPRELESIISRCLRKDPGQRFQRMADLKVALEELKLESESGPHTLAAPVGILHRHGLMSAIGALTLAAALGLGAWLGVFWRPSIGPVPRVSVFTALPGLQSGPAFSADGKRIAFVWKGEKQGNYNIYVQRLGEATARKLTSSSAQEYSPVWSPDASHIAFLRTTPVGTEVILIPAGGGTEQRLTVSTAYCQTILPQLATQYCGLAWSPDGKLLTFVDKETPRAPNSIFVLDLGTGQKRRLTTPPAGSGQDGLSAFSPDGKILAFARCLVPLCDIYVLSLSESGQPRGEPHALTRDNVFILGFDWAADGRSVIFASSRGGVYALWRVSVSGGNPERLRVGSSNAYFPSVSRNGERLAYSEGTTDFNIWRVAAPGAAGNDAASAAPIRITPSPQLDEYPDYSPDGRKIVWSSTHSGAHQVWVADSDGSQPLQLTHFGAPGAAFARWSPDGRRIAFLGFSRGPTHVYVVGAEGGTPRRLTTGDLIEGPTITPTWSNDGRWIYFVSNREGEAVWKVPAAGGSPVLVASQGSWPMESPDGEFLYYVTPGGEIRKVSAAGGSPVLVARNALPPLFQSFDGKFIYFEGPDRTIWKSPAAGGQATPALKIGERARWVLSAGGIYVLDPDSRGGPALELFPFSSARTAVLRLPGEPDSYAQGAGVMTVSRDGRWVLYPRWDRNDAQIMLVENFR